MVSVRRVAYLYVIDLAGESLVRVHVLNHALPLRLRSAAKSEPEGQFGVAANGVVVSCVELPDLVDLGRNL